MALKLNVTKEQVSADIKNVVAFLKLVDTVMPEQVDETLIAALQGIASNDALLTLLTTALQKI